MASKWAVASKQKPASKMKTHLFHKAEHQFLIKSRYITLVNPFTIT